MIVIKRCIVEMGYHNHVITSASITPTMITDDIVVVIDVKN